MEKKLNHSLWAKFMILQCLLVFSVAQSFDFFYFVQQWPGSYCDTDQGCCPYGNPASNFSIHGLWPNYNNGSYPSYCNSSYPFNQSEISDLLSRMQQDWPSLSCPSSNGTAFWSHEWDKHGTCSNLSEHAYFESALNLKDNLGILQILQSAGIQPDGGFYSLSSIIDAIESGIGVTPWIECNTDSSGNIQLYQIYICVDTSGLDVIECPVTPTGECSSSVEFPQF